MATTFINLIVSDGGDAGEEGLISQPFMNGDNLINTDIITFVKPVTTGGNAPNYIEIYTNIPANTLEVQAGQGTTEQVLKERVYKLTVSKAQFGDPSGAVNKPSAEWMEKAKKAISAALSNIYFPDSGRTTVSLPRDGGKQVYFRSIRLQYPTASTNIAFSAPAEEAAPGGPPGGGGANEFEGEFIPPGEDFS
jgi:hypothetical protein